MQKIYAICALFLAAQVVSGKEPDFVCKEGTMILNTHIMEGLGVCTEEFAENKNCKYFCSAEVFGLVNPDSPLPTQEAYDEWIDREFQEKDHASAKAYIAECFAKFGNIDLDDEECIEAKKFNDCTWGLPPQTC